MFLELWNTMLSPGETGASAPTTPTPAPSQPAAQEAPVPQEAPESSGAVTPPPTRGTEGFASKLMNLMKADAEPQATPAKQPQSTSDTKQQEAQPKPEQKDPSQMTLGELKEYVKDGKILGKFGKAEDLVKAYTEMEKWNTKLAQRIGLPEGLDNQRGLVSLTQDQQKQILDLTAELQSLKSGKAEQTPEQKAAEDELGFPLSAEEMNELLYSDPAKLMKAMQEHSAKTAQNQIEKWQSAKIKEQQEYQSKVEAWKSQMELTRLKYPNDFDEMMPEIKRIIDELPEIENLPGAIEVAYKVAKGEKLSTALEQMPKPKSPDELLKDAEFRSKILTDPEIKQQFLKLQAEELRKNRPPTVVSSQPGQAPVAPATQIRSTKEARVAAADYFKRLQQGLR